MFAGAELCTSHACKKIAGRLSTGNQTHSRMGRATYIRPATTSLAVRVHRQHTHLFLEEDAVHVAGRIYDMDVQTGCVASPCQRHLHFLVWPKHILSAHGVRA